MIGLLLPPNSVEKSKNLQLVNHEPIVQPLNMNQRWKKIPISSQDDYYFKFISTGNTYNLVITNLTKVFENFCNEENLIKDMKVIQQNT
jgi:hypothetical protein